MTWFFSGCHAIHPYNVLRADAVGCVKLICFVFFLFLSHYCTDWGVWVSKVIVILPLKPCIFENHICYCQNRRDWWNFILSVLLIFLEGSWLHVALTYGHLWSVTPVGNKWNRFTAKCLLKTGNIQLYQNLCRTICEVRIGVDSVIVC